MATGRVRGLFVYEEAESQFAQNFYAREGEEQSQRTHSSWLFNQWLRQECVDLGVTTIAARPWEDGIERAIASLES